MSFLVLKSALKRAYLPESGEEGDKSQLLALLHIYSVERKFWAKNDKEELGRWRFQNAFFYSILAVPLFFISFNWLLIWSFLYFMIYLFSRYTLLPKRIRKHFINRRDLSRRFNGSLSWNRLYQHGRFLSEAICVYELENAYYEQQRKLRDQSAHISDEELVARKLTLKQVSAKLSEAAREYNVICKQHASREEISDNQSWMQGSFLSSPSSGLSQNQNDILDNYFREITALFQILKEGRPVVLETEDPLTEQINQAYEQATKDTQWHGVDQVITSVQVKSEQNISLVKAGSEQNVDLIKKEFK